METDPMSEPNQNQTSPLTRWVGLSLMMGMFGMSLVLNCVNRAADEERERRREIKRDELRDEIREIKAMLMERRTPRE